MPAHMSEMHGYRASRHNSSGARRSTLLQSQGGCSLSDAAAPAPAPYPLRWLSFLAAELHLVLIMLHVSDVRAGCMVIGMSLPTMYQARHYCGLHCHHQLESQPSN